MSQPFKDAVSLCKSIMRNGYDAYVINARLQKTVLAEAGGGDELAMDISTELDFDGLKRLFPNVESSTEHGVTGLVAETTEQYAQAVGWLLNNPDKARAMGRAGRDKARRLFRAQDIAARLGGMYLELLARKGRGAQ